jgi:glucokinase
VVIGGAIGAYFERFSERLHQLLSDKFHDGYMPLLVKAAHPEEAVLYGCYYYALDVAPA